MRNNKLGGDMGLSALFKGLGGFLELVSDLAENQGEIHKEGNFEDDSGRVRGVYGITLRTEIGGKTRLETFGNVRRTESGPVVEETREPLFDLFDEGEEFHILVELPGADPSGISLHICDDILDIEAEGPGRKYAREILLPALPDRESLSHTFANGILEIRLKKGGSPHVQQD
ncbi:MAG: Hsp20/alpha crystallin family protein [Armatimonadetes bacterium]|nr:Hsp20/alpha crystallin family protein [Armatimonadota bacterium]